MRHGLKISHFGPCLEFGRLGGPSFPVHPSTRERRREGQGGTDALPALVPAILPALQGASLAALSRTGTSATRCWTLVGWPLV